MERGEVKSVCEKENGGRFQAISGDDVAMGK